MSARIGWDSTSMLQAGQGEPAAACEYSQFSAQDNSPCLLAPDPALCSGACRRLLVVGWVGPVTRTASDSNMEGASPSNHARAQDVVSLALPGGWEPRVCHT